MLWIFLFNTFVLYNNLTLYKYSLFHLLNCCFSLFIAASSLEEKRSFLDHIEQAKLVTNQLTTPRVVKMVGCVTLHEPHCLVMELPARGDLLSYLVSARNKVQHSVDVFIIPPQ